MWRYWRHISGSSISLLILGFLTRPSTRLKDSKKSNKHGICKGGPIDDCSMHNKIIAKCNKTNIKLVCNLIVYKCVIFRDLGDLMSSGSIKSSKYVVIIFYTNVDSYLNIIILNITMSLFFH